MIIEDKQVYLFNYQYFKSLIYNMTIVQGLTKVLLHESLPLFTKYI